MTHEPRPDLLEKVRFVLKSLHGLQVHWKVGSGPDRTRRIHFQVGSFTLAEALYPKLSAHLNERGCPFQCSFVSKAMNRITFDLLDRASVDNLFKTPPVIDHQTLYPSAPRFIRPVYALEARVLGVKDIPQAAPIIDRNIKSKYGDVIAYSRLALNGDAYCVVFNTWAETSRFLFDTFTAFDSRSGVSQSVSQAPSRPAPLYVLNSNDLLPFSARPPDSSNMSLHQLQAQCDRFGQILDTWARATEVLSDQLQHMTQQLQDGVQITPMAASFAGLYTSLSGSVRLQATISRLEVFQSEARICQVLLAFAPLDRSNAIVQHLQYLDSEIYTYRTQVEQLLASLPFPPPPLPPPSHLQ